MAKFLVSMELFRGLFLAIKDLAENASLEFSEDRFSIKAMDSAHVCFLVATLQKDMFSAYETKEEFHFGLNVSLMCTALQCMRQKGGSLQVVADEHELVLTSEDGGARFRLNSYADEGSDIIIPDDLAYTHTVELSSRAMKDATSDVLGLSDETQLTASDGFQIATHPEETLQRRWSVPTKSTDAMQLRVGAKYFHSMCKHSALSETVILEMDASLPVRLLYQFGVGSQLEFYLAPLV
jgi:proliferating cell nuclear antigen PCNA